MTAAQKAMTFDPTTNRVPMGLLTEEEKEILKAANYGWKLYSPSMGWVFCEEPRWEHFNIYRAKPAPMVKSVWVNVYADAAFGGLDVSAFHSEREEADVCAQRSRISVARFDLIDGVLSVELEPLDEEPE